MPPYVDYDLSEAPSNAGVGGYCLIVLFVAGLILAGAALIASTNPAWIVP